MADEWEELKSLVACEATKKPTGPDARAKDMKLELGYNVVYIVCAVVVEEDKVLMMQEAKPSCRGRWYLPAGRMEPNESIVDAVIREVVEETGLVFEPQVLIAVECHSFQWVRFTFTGRITGGSLKTPAQEDRESIQASWFPSDPTHLSSAIPLRAWDCLPLVKHGREWHQERERAGGRPPFSGLPALVGHVSSSLRVVAVSMDSYGVYVLVLLQPQDSTVFPAHLLGQEHMVHSYQDNTPDSIIAKTLKSCGCEEEFKTKGVLTVEHLGNPKGTYDGMCLTLVVQVTNQQLARGAQTQWVKVEDEDCAKRLREAVEKDFGCARLFHF